MIGDILVKEFSKKKKLSKNLAVFKEKMEFDRILNVENKGSYKQFGKISAEFHQFINNMKKSEGHIHYGSKDTQHGIHHEPPKNRTEARKSNFGNHLDIYSNLGDGKSEFGAPKTVKGGRGFGRKESVFTNKRASVVSGKNSFIGKRETDKKLSFGTPFRDVDPEMGEQADEGTPISQVGNGPASIFFF